jgi:predicted Zn-dependent protease
MSSVERFNRTEPYLLGALVAAVILAVSCAINPATGRRHISLIGEQQELAIGREEDKRVVQTIGLYGGPELQAYVQRVGTRLAAKSERPDLPWTFRVVDDASVNAFALPGGYIYVTRGIMAHLNSEAELAAVLGHEIGHVTARHSVNQMSKAQLATLGLGIGAAVSEDVRSLGRAAEAGLGLLFLKYSRDDERQADELGLRYVMRTTYDPRPMVDVFVLLDRIGRSTEGGRVPGWLSTHPAPANRQADAERRIAALGQDLGARELLQAAYYQHIDGMVFGPDPREGFFRGTRFVHPGLRFEMAFPQSYTTANQKGEVIGVSPEQDAVVALSLAPGTAPQDALSAFFGQGGIQPGAEWNARIHGFPTAARYFTARLEQGTLHGLVAFVAYGGRVYRLIGYAPSSAWPAREAAVEGSIASFDRLIDPQLFEVQPMRIEIVHLQKTLALSNFARTYDAAVDVSTLAVLNNLDPGATLEPGRPYKVVVS